MIKLGVSISRVIAFFAVCLVFINVCGCGSPDEVKEQIKQLEEKLKAMK
jgi:hypothetical protein